MPSLDGIESEAEFIDVDKFRRDIDSRFIKPLSQALAGAFPVDIRAIKMMSKRIPLGRVAQPVEIKGLALFLASPASGFVPAQRFQLTVARPSPDERAILSDVIGSCQAAGVLERVSASMLTGARRSDPRLYLVRAMRILSG